MLAFGSPSAQLIPSELAGEGGSPQLCARLAAGGEALGLDRALYAAALEGTDGEDFFF